MSDELLAIDEIRRVREKKAHFFSNAGKPERERWVVREFLTRLGLQFSDNELKAQPENGPVDVVFREASFQIKEIADPAERRHAGVKESLQRATRATTIQDLYGPPEARDIVPADLSTLLLEIASSPKYPLAVRSSLDLLVYVTRPYAGFNEPQNHAAAKLRVLGWRSISCLFGERPLLLVSTSTSPSFLHQE